MPDAESPLSISDIKVRLVEHGTDGLLAWASCVVAGSIKLDNIAIRRGRDGGLFLTYPVKRTDGGDRYQYFNPITRAAAQAVERAIMTRIRELSAVSRPSPAAERE